MAILFALIFSSLLVLLNISQQIHGTTAPLAGSNILPCTESNGYVSTPLASQFWTLNSSYFEVSLGIMNPYFIYLFVVTSIDIELGNGSDGINISQYLITYTRDNVYSAPLSELSTNMSRTSKSAKVTIKPIFINKMSISRFIDSNDNFLVRYIIKGFSTPRIEVLSYLIEQPNLNRDGVIISDNSYTGMCNGEVCYGGRGQLMDGVIGMESDNSASGLKIGWRCTVGNIICSFPLRILLTGQVIVSHLILYGTTTSTEVISPNVTLIQPNIATNSTLNTVTNTYTLTIPINLLTDTIFLNMEIPGGRAFVLSEVEVFSNGVNIALFNVEYRESIEPVSTTTQTPVSCAPSPTISMTSPTTSVASTVVSTSNTNPPSTSTNDMSTTGALNINQVDSIPFIIFPLIIAALLIILGLVSSCCIYLLIEKEKLKKMTPSRKFIYVNTNQGNELLRLQEKYPYPINGEKTGTSTINTTTQLPHESGMYEEIDFSRVKERDTVSVEIEGRTEKNQATPTYYNTSENVQNVGTTNPFVEPTDDLLPTTEIAIAEYEEMMVKDLENKVQ